jgi:hypothetical protein
MQTVITVIMMIIDDRRGYFAQANRSKSYVCDTLIVGNCFLKEALRSYFGLFFAGCFSAFRVNEVVETFRTSYPWFTIPVQEVKEKIKWKLNFTLKFTSPLFVLYSALLCEGNSPIVKSSSGRKLKTTYLLNVCTFPLCADHPRGHRVRGLQCQP